MNWDESRRPIEDWERPWLEGLGALLRHVRMASGQTQARTAIRAGLAERSLRRIEHGQRRTRGSTLARLASAVATSDPDGGAAADLLRRLLDAGGPAVAPGSEFAARVDARRGRRNAQRAARWVTQHTQRFTYEAGGVWEHHVHRRRVGRHTVREREYWVFVADDGRRFRIKPAGGLAAGS